MMAQMHQSADGQSCPGCEEPVESGDRFCGACGYDLSALPAPGGAGQPARAAGTPVEWPAAAGTDTSGMSPPTQHAADLAESAASSAGGPAGAQPAGAPVPPPAGPAPQGHSPAGGAAPAAPAGAHDGGGVPAGGAAPRSAPLPPAAGSGAPGSAHPPVPPAAAPAGAGPAGHAAPPVPPTAPVPPMPSAARPAGAADPGYGAAASPAGPPATAGGAAPTGPGGASAPGSAHPSAPSAPPAGALPAQAAGAAAAEQAGGAVRYDTPASGDFELAAPRPGTAVAVDPRTAQPLPAPAAAAGGKLCVACRAGRVDTDGYCENCGHAQPRERDHMEQELGSVAAVSDRGLRHHRNEDAFAVSTTALPDGSPAVVAVVCDGVSSATRPDEASAAAARAANEQLLAALPRGTHPQQAMREAIVAASEAVNSLAATDPDPESGRHRNAPACTIVGAVSAGGLLVVGWVGDSRAYWVPDDRSGPPARLTEDDSWAAQMVAAGLMNEAEAYADERAHAITGWLGADAYELDPHTQSFKPDRPGVVVVCTDGLWNYAEGADDMARVVPGDAALRPLHSAQMLVGHALDGGGHDNVTVAVLPFAVPGGEPVPQVPATP